MSKCGKCWMRYCSNACSLRHWPVHKPICKILTSWLETHKSKSRKSKKYAALLHEHITPGMGFCFLNEEQYATCLRTMRRTCLSMMYDIRHANLLMYDSRPRGGGGEGGRPPRGPGGRRSPRRLYKAPTDYTKPRNIRQSPRNTTYTNHLNIRQRPKILNNTLQY